MGRVLSRNDEIKNNIGKDVNIYSVETSDEVSIFFSEKIGKIGK